MNRYIENLKNFLAEQIPNYSYADANSILELLYHCYMESNPVDNVVIRYQFKELDSILSHLSLKENDRVFYLVSNLCITHERQAFIDGVHVGMQLFSELDDLPG